MANLSATRLCDSALARFGEPIQLPGGTVVVGVVDLPGGSAALQPRGTQTRGEVPVSNLVMPQFLARTSDLAALEKSASVTIRGVTYLVVSLDPDGAGLTTVELALPGAESGPRPEWRPWR